MTTRNAGRHIKAILADRGWRTGTDVEDRVALALSRCGWKPTEVRQQFSLLSYRLDFAWPEVAVCVEADGWYHQNLNVIEKDRRRDAQLRDAGWLTFRVDWTADEDVLMLQVAKLSRLIRMMLADESFRDWARDARDAPATHDDRDNEKASG